MLIGYTVDEEADLEKFLVGIQGIVEDHCDDDNVSGEIKQRWADMEDTDTDDMSSDAVYDDISGQQLDGTFVREARMNELEGLSNMGVWDIVDKGVCYQKTGKPPIRGRWSTSTRAMTRAQCIDPGLLLKSFDAPAKDSSRQCHPWRPSRR